MVKDAAQLEVAAASDDWDKAVVLRLYLSPLKTSLLSTSP